jgi:hypothetical protein
MIEAFPDPALEKAAVDKARTIHPMECLADFIIQIDETKDIRGQILDRYMLVNIEDLTPIAFMISNSAKSTRPLIMHSMKGFQQSESSPHRGSVAISSSVAGRSS